MTFPQRSLALQRLRIARYYDFSAVAVDSRRKNLKNVEPDFLSEVLPLIPFLSPERQNPRTRMESECAGFILQVFESTVIPADQAP